MIVDTRAVAGSGGSEPSAGAGPGAGGREGLSIRPQLLQLSPLYRRARDSILRPHLRLTESRYFWEKWKPLLGPDAAVLVMEVRDRCNRALTSPDGHLQGPEGLDGPEGQGCTVSANDLAAACGFSRVTLWRLLQREDVRQFVQVEHNYIYDQRMGKKRRTVSTYHVLMEDPLVPADEPRLEQLLAASGAAPTATAGGASGVAAQRNSGATFDVASDSRPTFQTATEVVDNSPPRFQNEAARSRSILKPQNVQETTLKKRLAGTGTTPSTASVSATAPAAVTQHAHGTRGGDPTRLESLLDATLFQRPAATPGATPSATPAAVPAAGTPRSESVSRGPVGEIDIWQRFPEFAHHIEEAETQLGDWHSRGFYVNALKRLYPGHIGVWQRALGVAREQKAIRRSRGALFTRLLRTFAAEAGVSL